MSTVDWNSSVSFLGSPLLPSPSNKAGCAFTVNCSGIIQYHLYYDFHRVDFHGQYSALNYTYDRYIVHAIADIYRAHAIRDVAHDIRYISCMTRAIAHGAWQDLSRLASHRQISRMARDDPSLWPSGMPRMARDIYPALPDIYPDNIVTSKRRC